MLAQKIAQLEKEIERLSSEVTAWKQLANADLTVDNIKIFQTGDGVSYVVDNKQYGNLEVDPDTVKHFMEYTKNSILGFFTYINELSELSTDT